MTDPVDYAQVAAHLQARGLGRKLLQAAEDLALDRYGATRIEMTVIVQRGELIEWYQRRGYALTGETRPFPMTDPRFGVPRRSDARDAPPPRRCARGSTHATCSRRARAGDRPER